MMKDWIGFMNVFTRNTWYSNVPVYDVVGQPVFLGLCESSARWERKGAIHFDTPLVSLSALIVRFL